MYPRVISGSSARDLKMKEYFTIMAERKKDYYGSGISAIFRKIEAFVRYIRFLRPFEGQYNN